MSKEKKVVSVNGQEYPISKCRKFEKGYYLIGEIDVVDSGDCYLIDGKYYRIETDQVVFDYEIGKYVLKNNTLIFGIIGFEEDKIKYGHFSKGNKNVLVNLEDGSRYTFIDEELLKNRKDYRERLADGHFYHINLLSATEFTRIKVPAAEYKTSLPYDSGGVLKDYIQKHDRLEMLINQNVTHITPLVKSLTFGLEFETIAGYLPERILDTTGLIPLRDGSISGIEYVTVPLKGEKGLQTIVNASKALESRTKYDKTCALHLHIGNVPRTPEFILAMFKFTCATQDEMYSMFPLYKKYNFGVKNKNYSKPYPVFNLLSRLDPIITGKNINQNFEVLYQYLSMGERFSDLGNDLRNVKVHPADRDNRAKWNIKTRYYLNNLIPLIFGNKQTVEFRIHTATLDNNKIMYFTLLSAAMVNFVIENTESILKDPNFLIQYSKLSMVLRNQFQNAGIRSSSFRDNTRSKLEEYLNLRKDVTESQNRSGNIVGNEDQIVVNRPIDWLRVLDPKKKALYTELKSKFDLDSKLLHEAYLVQKKRVMDGHLRGDLSLTMAQRELDIVEKQYRNEMKALEKQTPELAEILNQTPW